MLPSVSSYRQSWRNACDVIFFIELNSSYDSLHVVLSVAVAFRCDGTVSACNVKYMVEMLKFSCDIACACYDTNCVTDRVVAHGDTDCS